MKDDAKTSVQPPSQIAVDLELGTEQLLTL